MITGREGDVADEWRTAQKAADGSVIRQQYADLRYGTCQTDACQPAGNCTGYCIITGKWGRDLICQPGIFDDADRTSMQCV